MKQETAGQNIKNQLKSSTENKKIEELRVNKWMVNFTGTFKDPHYIKKNSWHGHIAQS
jgi:hypothetical protein